MMVACVLVDIDGTLADNSHRQHYLQKTPKDWDGFFSQQHLDAPHEAVVWMVRLLSRSAPIMLCTGRMQKHKQVTVEWLRRHDIPVNGNLFMRRDDDFRPDYIVKRELLDQIRAKGWEPKLVIDDRTSVVRMWRGAGLVCLQCADGDF